MLQVLLATFLDSLVAFIGVIVLRVKNVVRVTSLLAAFAAGALLSGGMLHLFAEAVSGGLVPVHAGAFLLLGFSSFLLLELLLKWHHCNCVGQPEPFTYLILLADGVHNFFDGVIIGASFLVSFSFGWFTTLLIILHEVPQELGDYGILVYGGMNKLKALSYNFVSQLTCVAGGVLGWLAIGGVIPEALAFSAGGFLYISASDLVPRMKESAHLIAFFLGLMLLALPKLVL